MLMVVEVVVVVVLCCWVGWVERWVGVIRGRNLCCCVFWSHHDAGVTVRVSLGSLMPTAPKALGAPTIGTHHIQHDGEERGWRRPNRNCKSRWRLETARGANDQ